MSRLRLDFSLDSNEERKQFIDSYIENEIFQKRPPTEEELEMMGNYILWGKDETGQNVVQKKEIEIETRNKTWSRRQIESLDELTDSPTFLETSLRPLEGPPKKIPREVFSRQEALSRSEGLLKETFKRLFSRIDEIDLLLNYCDLLSGKRINPPREELLKAFSEEEREKIEARAQQIKRPQYWKLRHLLVELRKEQYTLGDSFREEQRPQNILLAPAEEVLPKLGEEIPVFPLGLFSKDRPEIFKPFPQFKPGEKIRIDYPEKKKNFSFSFEELEHVYQLILQYGDFLQEIRLGEDSAVTLEAFLKTFLFYVERAELSIVQKEILNLKIKRARNQDISFYINKKFSKTYTDNYISTIFRQKIIPQINKAASTHRKILESIHEEKNFKSCISCGKLLLRDPDNFVRKSRAQDGLSNRCKKCDKRERDLRKEILKGGNSSEKN